MTRATFPNTTLGGAGVGTGVSVGVGAGVADGMAVGVGKAGPLHAARSRSAAGRLRRLIGERYCIAKRR